MVLAYPVTVADSSFKCIFEYTRVTTISTNAAGLIYLRDPNQVAKSWWLQEAELSSG